MLEKKEEYIEAEILAYFMEKGCKVNYKNDIKGFYNAKKGHYQKNKSNFIRNGISDITVYRKGLYIAIEVKRPSEMKYFDVSYQVANERYIKAEITGKGIKRAKHAKEQREFLDDIISEGGVAFFASSLDQVIERLGNNNINL